MTEHLSIADIRRAIDEADDILLKALAARFRAVRHLRDIKKAVDMEVESKSREAELKTRWKAKAEELDISPELALLILDFILTDSKHIQNQ